MTGRANVWNWHSGAVAHRPDENWREAADEYSSGRAGFR